VNVVALGVTLVSVAMVAPSSGVFFCLRYFAIRSN
jgi:hypothetical protein